ncbi:hypothetical protein Lepto1489_19505 [Leptospira interrogans serovar Bataviae]|uniref:Uncharacterized protein n=1 Tax=Leptospira interrogans serovar Bataviae TaxID=312175 RepID=A0AAQ0B4P6_LEPIR|nr:hypothetical protein Lepto1489_19505 [Leptospira interrogans serovar Bataviae]
MNFFNFTNFYKIEYFRQNGAPSGLENRGLDARFAFTTKQENRQKERNEKKSICRNGCPQRNDSNCIFNE